jgi:hypothetical protein
MKQKSTQERGVKKYGTGSFSGAADDGDEYGLEE